MRILRLEEGFWAKELSSIIQSEVEKNINLNGSCNVVITGGSTVIPLYRNWSSLGEFKALRNVNFYLSDERMVPIASVDSNENLINNSLFRYGVPKDCIFHSIMDERLSIDNICKKYERKLPAKFDIGILTVGDDGHVASLFEVGHPVILGHKVDGVITTKSNVHKHLRVTISNKLLQTIDKTYVLACSNNKKEIYRRIKKYGNKLHFYPVSYVNNPIWVLS